jgi:phage baseplate assembly protein gpV
MKKLINTLLLATIVIPISAIANQAATQVPVNNGQVTLESPRTGIQYIIPNPDQRPVVIQTQAIEAANSATADRIVASNPALSTESQEQAKQELIRLTK